MVTPMHLSSTWLRTVASATYCVLARIMLLRLLDTQSTSHLSDIDVGSLLFYIERAVVSK